MLSSICCSITFEFRRKQSLKIYRLNRGKGWSTKKDLLNGPSCLPEVEKKELHQTRLFIGTKDLLESIQAPRSLVLDSRRWKTSMLLGERVVSLLLHELSTQSPSCRCIPDELGKDGLTSGNRGWQGWQGWQQPGEDNKGAACLTRGRSWRTKGGIHSQISKISVTSTYPVST